VLNSCFGNFSVPSKSEGFNEVIFEWRNEKESSTYLKNWILERKRTSRVDDLKVSQWFYDKHKDWLKQFADYQVKLEASKPSEEKKDGGKESKDEEEDDDKTAASKVDIFTVEDVCDVGGGEPLFRLFAFEDWAMMQLRFELFLLMAAFKKDVDDPERVGIHESNLTFYYNKYYRKQLTPKYFGVADNKELTALVADTATWSDDQVLTTPIAEDASFDMFVKLTEEKRRERQRRLDAGDETARLKFLPLAMPHKGAAAASGASARPAGLVPGKKPQQDQHQEQGQQGPAATGAVLSPGQTGQGQKWGSANRSTPYGQGAYGQGGFKPSGPAAKGGGKGAGGSWGSWGRKW